MDDFISDDDLKTFEGWLRYQAVSPASDAEREEWRRLFEGVRQRADAAPKVGLMKLQPVPGEYRYALALRDGDDLWLTLWVRRSRKGEFFVLIPRGERDWDIHLSYHLDGTMHMKTHGAVVLSPQKRQPLTGNFRGSEHLGAYAGHGKSVGAVCDPNAFTGVVEVPPGILGPRHGQVTVDLVEPDHEPVPFPWKRMAVQRTFRDVVPWVVITVGTT